MPSLSLADYRGSLGRYALFGEIASGGMATVHFARLMGAQGFARTVAVKRMHAHLAKDPDLVAMFLEEARLAARVRHPNVVATLDVVSEGDELFLVMEYVAGESLSRLARKSREARRRIPPSYAVAMVIDALEGLHAAHEATDERGQPLGIVHRDVSPQNLHVGVDGTTRVLDFGIAKATAQSEVTRGDQIKGKLAYMAPEQLAGRRVDRRTDVYAASVILWELLAGTRLFSAEDVPSLVYAVANAEMRPPSAFAPTPEALDAIVLRGLARDPQERWPSARAMAEALERVLRPAAPRKIGGFVVATAGEALAWRQEVVARVETSTSSVMPSAPYSGHPSPHALECASGVVPAGSVPDFDELMAPREVPARPGAARSGSFTRTALVLLVASTLAVGFGAWWARRASWAQEGAAQEGSASTAASQVESQAAPEPAVVLGRGQRPTKK